MSAEWGTADTVGRPGTDRSGEAVQARAFDEAVLTYWRELHLHCYRMLGSFEDAEDTVQETYLRAWRSEGGLDGLHNPRAWLYRVATNACLDLLRSKGRRLDALGSFRDLPWLEPYPDALLHRAGGTPTSNQPDSAAVARETIELTFVAVIQLLPPGQRAALVLRDVLSWPVPEVAAMLELSAAAVNSLLQRARATLRQHLPLDARDSWDSARRTETERVVLERYIAAHESGDVAAALELISDDIRITMPPARHLYEGRVGVETLMARAEATGSWRLLPVAANRQPAAACYLRAPGGLVFTAFKIDVLRVAAGKVVEVTTFGVKHFPAFGLPPELPELRGLPEDVP